MAKHIHIHLGDKNTVVKDEDAFRQLVSLRARVKEAQTLAREIIRNTSASTQEKAKATEVDKNLSRCVSELSSLT